MRRDEMRKRVPDPSTVRKPPDCDFRTSRRIRRNRTNNRVTAPVTVRFYSQLLKLCSEREEFLPHQSCILGLLQTLVRGNQVAVKKTHQMRIHRDHAEARTRLNI